MSTFKAMQRIALILSAALFLSSLVSAAEQEYVCEAKQNSKSSLPLLSHECPVGKGLWGKKPDSEQGLFWIQCGLSGIPLSFKKAQPIYSNVVADVWLKREQQRYRCLIGPYDTYSAAKSDLVKVRQLELYKEAFIRDASSGSDNKPDKVVIDETSVIATTAPKPEDVTLQPKQTKTVVVRRDVKIGNNYFAIPYLMGSDEQYYMEHGIAWNRLSYDKALQLCQLQQMRLPVAEEWQTLHCSQVMAEKQWPLQLPYWGEGKQGLFSSGKVTQLSGVSLLNVVCVK